MGVPVHALRRAIRILGSVPGIKMNANDLAQDTVLLSQVLDEESEFLMAVNNTARALEQISKGVVATSPLSYDLRDWRSYHYQHRIGQRSRADMRIIFKEVDGVVYVRAFGHRFLPEDIYRRIMTTR